MQASLRCLTLDAAGPPYYNTSQWSSFGVLLLLSVLLSMSAVGCLLRIGVSMVLRSMHALHSGRSRHEVSVALLAQEKAVFAAKCQGVCAGVEGSPIRCRHATNAGDQQGR